MAGHSPEPTVRAVAEQAARGITADAAERGRAGVAEELARRFGLPRWQFALTATDANRFVIRLARQITGRPKILVFDCCYHGTVDEAFATLDADGTRRRRARATSARPSPLDETTRVVEFNDAEALERELAHGDVACVLAEPALTNIGIVLPEPGFHDGAARDHPAPRHAADHRRDAHALRRARRVHARHGLEPDLLTVGKSIGGGIACAAYGISDEVAAAGRGVDPAGRVRRRRRRRHARRQRAVARRDAGDAPRCSPTRRSRG